MNESPLSDQRIRSVFFDSSRKLEHWVIREGPVDIWKAEGFYSPAELLHEGWNLFPLPHGFPLCSQCAFFKSLDAFVVRRVFLRLLLLEVVAKRSPGVSRRVKDLSRSRGYQSSAAEPSPRKCRRRGSRDPLCELTRSGRHHVRIHIPCRRIRVHGPVRRCAVPSQQMVLLRRRELLLLHRGYRYRYDGRCARCCPFPRVRRRHLRIHSIGLREEREKELDHRSMIGAEAVFLVLGNRWLRSEAHRVRPAV
jgi:hypothetical protein